MTATPRAKTAPVPTLGVPAAPPLPEDLEALLRRLRLPHIRRHAPEVLGQWRGSRDPQGRDRRGLGPWCRGHNATSCTSS